MLVQQLTDYINAAFTDIWVHTFEPDEAEAKSLSKPGRNNGSWPFGMWRVASETALLTPILALATPWLP